MGKSPSSSESERPDRGRAARPLVVAVCQAAPVLWDAERTLQKLESEILAMHQVMPNVALYVYPELFLTGYGSFTQPVPRDHARRCAEPIPGPTTNALCSLAAELQVWLVPGTVYELGDDGVIYNTAVAISPAGEVVAKYRKCFPWRPFEECGRGDRFVVFDIPGHGRAGLMICYDGYFPEVARHLAYMGADIVFQPTATTTCDRDQEVILARANAIANQMWIVNCTIAGSGSFGRSVIVDPEGHIRAAATDGEQVLTCAVDVEAARRTREHGTIGLTRPWADLLEGDIDLELPLYGGRLVGRGAPSLDEPANGSSELGNAWQ